jgi:hypothetical protein
MNNKEIKDWFVTASTTFLMDDATRDNAVQDYLTHENATQWLYFNNPR